MSSLSSATLTAGFIDLATYDELEKYMYGGPNATAYFVRETRKSTWFTLIPTYLSKANGSPNFGQEWSVSISRAGDYLVNTWLRMKLPAMTVNAATAGAWSYCPNFMHNLLEKCQVTFNDLVAAEFNSAHLDFWAAFTVPASKRNGYNNMIGNTSDMLSLATINTAKPAKYLDLPLPFFYSRDSGVALPTAALPYNDMRIKLKFRALNDLVALWDLVAGQYVPSVDAAPSSTTAISSLDAAVWATYAIVSNDERKRMACAPRDILIEQVQMAPTGSFTPATNPNPSFDIRFSHAVKGLYFAVRHKNRATYLNAGWRSNYMVGSAVAGAIGAVPAVPAGFDVDPISLTSLVYENTQRLSKMGSDFYSLVNPYYHFPSIPNESGYHAYSYSLDAVAVDPMGSTNYGKLTNVSIQPEPSALAVTEAGAASTQFAAAAGGAASYEFLTTAVNNNIVRVAGGALGFPVL